LPHKAQAGDMVQHVPYNTARRCMRVCCRNGDIVCAVLLPKLCLQSKI
jgi:hypothetical protein